MRLRICNWIKKPCCGVGGWLFRILRCSDFEKQPKERFSLVKVCDKSGLLAHEACPVSYEKSFIKGEEPKKYCTRHKRLKKYGG